MGPYIDSLKVGDALELKGPIPKYPYQVQPVGYCKGIALRSMD